MKKVMLLAVVFILLVLPVFSFIGVGAASADDGLITKIEKYPGPFGPYEKDKVTVACAQIESVWGDTAATLEKMKAMVQLAAEQGADIILFPEVILNSSRASDPAEVQEEMAEPFPGPSSTEMAKLGEKYGVYVVYGFYEKNPDPTKRMYNSVAIIGPKGIIGKYRKIHPAVENTERGYQPVAFKTPWGPVGISVCSDTYGFPELSRTYALMGARLLLNPTRLAQGGGQREQVPKAITCRAAENFFFVATTNVVGKRDPYVYWGESFICGPLYLNYEPTIWAGPASDSEEELIIAELDLKWTDNWRNITMFFQEHERQHEPLFLPELWANIWGISDEEVIALNQELEAKNQEQEALRADYLEVQQKANVSLAVAVILLATTVVFGTLFFVRKRK